MARMRSGSAQGLDLQAIEMRRAVGLGPQPDPAWLGEAAVHRGEQLAAIEGDRQPVALDAQAQRLPSLTRYPNLDARNLGAAPVHDAVKAEVVLQRIGPRDVVVARVAEAHH